MWIGYTNALISYHNLSLQIWHERGYKNIKLKPIKIEGTIVMPPWIGNEEFHKSHQSNLLRKNEIYYKDKFPKIPNNLPYIWPEK